MKSIIEWTAAEIKAAKLSRSNMVNVRIQELAKSRRLGLWFKPYDILTWTAYKRLKNNGIIKSVSLEYNDAGNCLIMVSAS